MEGLIYFILVAVVSANWNEIYSEITKWFVVVKALDAISFEEPKS